MVYNTESSQGQIFAECGVPNLIKQVVQVSKPATTQFTCRAITRPFLLTVRLGQAKPSPWKVTNTR